jgi:mannose-6-phosphate isomerase
MRFEPLLRELIWGGRRLGTVLHKPIGPAGDYAESWEISDYHDKVSVVKEGPLEGASLRDLVRTRGEELLGPGVGARDQFPLLVKFIDAREPLSVQVHPDDEAGQRLAGDNGKTETWVILAADPGSLIYAGLRRGVGAEELTQAIGTGDVEPLLHRFQPRPGDSILIEAGTVHAIGAGVLLLEIQQMSDATFRVYDWNRVGGDGQPRPLHIREAMESIDFDRGPVDPVTPASEELPGGGMRERLARSPYFALERLHTSRPARVGRHDRFTIVVGLDGRSDLVSGPMRFGLEAGQTLLLPAAVGPCEVVPHGQATILTCVVPSAFESA